MKLGIVGIVKMTIVKNELRSEYSQITPSVIEAINNRAHWYEDYNAGVRCLVLGILLSSLVLMMGWPMVKGAKITVKL